MKKTGLFVLLLATAAWAQGSPDATLYRSPPRDFADNGELSHQRVQTPTYADLYCAGFISKQIPA